MKRKGFSLLEAMIAMGLVFLILGLIATLMREYTGVNRLTSSKDATLDGVQFALREMRNELGSALDVMAPTTVGSTSSSLAFTKINPRLGEDRIPYEFPAPIPANWAHADPSHLLDVVYARSGGKLIRTVTGLPTTSRQEVAAKIDGLTVFRKTRRNYVITVSFQELNRLKTYTLMTKRWVSPKALNP